LRYTMEASIKEPNVLQTYEELKTEFEKHACRIDDVLLYPVLDTKNERTLYTLLQLKESILSRGVRKRGTIARRSKSVSLLKSSGWNTLFAKSSPRCSVLNTEVRINYTPSTTPKSLRVPSSRVMRFLFEGGGCRNRRTHSLGTK